MKWLNKTIWGFGLTSFFNDFSHEMTTVILPLFMEHIVGLSQVPIALGIISGVSHSASTGMKLLAGAIADKLRTYKPLLLIGYAITPLFVGLIGTAHRFWQILVYKTVAWMGRGMREPIRDKWISEIVSPAAYGRAFGFNRAFDTLGAIIGPLCALIFLNWFSLRTIFLLSFIPGICSIISLLVFTQDYSSDQNKQSNTAQQLLPITSINLPLRMFLSAMFIFGCAQFHKTLLIFRAQEILDGYTQNSLLASGSAIALYIFFNIIRALSEFIMGFMSDYTNRRIILAIIGFGFYILTCLGLIYSPQNYVGWLLIFICAGISTGTITSIEKAYIAQLLPESQRGLGFGTLEAINGIAALISGIIIGGIWSLFNPTSAFIYCAFLSTIALVILLTKKDR
jgi:MFS family permease